MAEFLRIMGVLSWGLGALVLVLTLNTLQGPIVALLLIINGSVLVTGGSLLLRKT